MTIDHEGCITEFNPAAERTFGYRRDEVVGQQLADIIIPPALRERHRQGFARYLATGEARVLGQRIEMTAVRADGANFPPNLRSHASRWTGHRPSPATCATSRNANSRRRSCDAARRSWPKANGSANGSFSGESRQTKSFGLMSPIGSSSLTADPPVTFEVIGTRSTQKTCRACEERLSDRAARRHRSQLDFRLNPGPPGQVCTRLRPLRSRIGLLGSSARCRT